MVELITGVTAASHGLTQNRDWRKFEQAFQLVDYLLSNTDRQQGYSQSPASQALLNDALDTAQVGVVFVSLTGQVTYFNQKFAEIWKISPGILFAQKHSQYLAYCRTQVKDPAVFCDYIEQLNEQPRAAGIATVELKDGRSIEQCFRPQRLDQQVIGRVWGYAETSSPPAAQVPSYQKEAVLEKAQLSPNLLTHFMAWAADTSTIIFTVESSGNHTSKQHSISYANPAAEEATGYARSEMRQDAQFSKLAEQTLQPAAAQNGECLITTKSGQRRWLQYSKQMLTVNPQPLTVLVMTDVTSLKQKNLYLSQQLAREKSLTQQRLQLSAHIVHRALSSLNIVSMTADALEMYDTHWNETQKRNYLLKIRVAFERLHQLVKKMNDIGQLGTDKSYLSFSRDNSATDGSVKSNSIADSLASDKPSAQSLVSIDPVPIDPVPVDVYKVCCDLVENFKGTYREHAFVSLNTAEHTTVGIDENLLRSIIASLLDNAGKYSSNSLIKLVFSRKRNSIALRVQDSGIGVPPSECDRLFDPFYRASNVGDIVGLGLGLTIAKASTDVLAGQIKLVSAVDSGTVATVVLPVA